jgi:hypothetical protein
MHTKFWLGRNHPKKFRVDGMIILKLIVRKECVWGCGLDSSDRGQGEFLDLLNNYQLLKKDPVPGRQLIETVNITEK